MRDTVKSCHLIYGDEGKRDARFIGVENSVRNKTNIVIYSPTRYAGSLICMYNPGENAGETGSEGYSQNFVIGVSVR